MKIRLPLLLSLCLWLAGLLPAPAQEVIPYLSAEELPDAVKFLPPPPEAGSAAFAYDEARHQWGKSLRGTPRGLQAVREVTTDIDTMAQLFSGAFGRVLNREETPHTMALLERSIWTIRLGATHPKAAYMRLRPYVYYGEGTLVPEEEESSRNTGSYPSGHSVRGWGMALVLAQLNPERQDTLLVTGYEWGESRVIAGYHWQSDVNASRLLASACFARLQSCPDYLADLAAARAELAALDGASSPVIPIPETTVIPVRPSGTPGHPATGEYSPKGLSPKKWSVSLGSGISAMGPLSVSVFYAPARRFSLGLDYTVYTFARLQDGSAGPLLSNSDLMLGIRGEWFREGTFAIYAEAEAGYSSGAARHLGYQLKPFGITCGEKLFFFANLGYGCKYSGAEIGLGYHF